MPNVIIATDSEGLVAEVRSVLPNTDHDVRVATSGPAVLQLAREQTPDLVVLDLQIGNMGGIAICLDLRLEQSAGRLPAIPVVLLLDRRADVFLARRAGAEGFVLKPLDPMRLRKAIGTVLAGDTYEDISFRPPTTVG